MPSLSSMPAFSTEGVVDSCRVSMVRLARSGRDGTLRGTALQRTTTAASTNRHDLARATL